MRARIYAYRDRIIATPRYLPHPHPEIRKSSSRTSSIWLGLEVKVGVWG